MPAGISDRQGAAARLAEQQDRPRPYIRPLLQRCNGRIDILESPVRAGERALRLAGVALRPVDIEAFVIQAVRKAPAAPLGKSERLVPRS